MAWTPTEQAAQKRRRWEAGGPKATKAPLERLRRRWAHRRASLKVAEPKSPLLRREKAPRGLSDVPLSAPRQAESAVGKCARCA